MPMRSNPNWKGAPRKVTDEQAKEIVDLVKRGFTYLSIGKKLKIDHTTVARHALMGGVSSSRSYIENRIPKYLTLENKHLKLPIKAKKPKFISSIEGSGRICALCSGAHLNYNELLKCSAKRKFIRDQSGSLMKIEFVRKKTSLQEIIASSRLKTNEKNWESPIQTA